MSSTEESLKKFDRYLAEIKEKCLTSKNDISQEQYDKFLSYFKEASEFLKDKENTNQLAMQINDKAALVAKCDEIILKFTKYFIAKRDESRDDKLRSTSLMKAGTVAFKANENDSREVQHILSSLKSVYYDRFENAIKILNKLDDEKSNLEKLRVRFYQAKNPAECKAVLWQLNNKYLCVISNEIPELEKLVASYSNIIDKQVKINSPSHPRLQIVLKFNN